MHRHLVLAQPHRNRPQEFGIVERQDAVQRLDEFHFAAELTVGDAQLEPDVAGADYHQLARQFLQLERLGRRDNVAAEWHERQLGRPRACGENHVLGRDAHAAVGRPDVAGLSVAKGGPALQQLDARFLQQRFDAAVELVDNRLLPCHQRTHVQQRAVGERDAHLARASVRTQFLEAARSVDYCLRRDAAANQAGAAGAVTLDDDCLEPELPGADGGDVASRSGADYQHLAFAFHG